MKLTEEWRPVVGFVGYYEVSNLGNVRSISRKVREKSPKGGYFQEGRIIAKYIDYNGYCKAHLCRDGICVSKFIHRLVAEAFLPNPDNLPIINHKDENPSNNVVSNLEWCTNQYNVTYGTAIQKRQDSTRKPIYQLDKDTKEIVKVWKYAGEVAKYFGCSNGRIFGWCQDYAEAEGFIWCYAEDYKEGYWSGKIYNTYHHNEPLYQLDKQTLQIVERYEKLIDVENNGYNAGSVGNCCNGKNRSHRGFYWCYVKDYNPDTFKPKKMNHHTRKVAQFDLQTGEELGRWESLREMTKATGYLGPHVGQCCRGLRSESYGYGWRYID